MAVEISEARRARMRDRLFKLLSSLTIEYPASRKEIAKLLWPNNPSCWGGTYTRADGRTARATSRIYRYFTPEELTEIEVQALAIRRRKYSLMLAKVDDGVLKRGAEGDPQAAKLAYQRFEGWEPSEKKKIDVTGEIRAQVVRELLDEIGADNQGFSDLFPGGGKEDDAGEPGTGDDSEA